MSPLQVYIGGPQPVSRAARRILKGEEVERGVVRILPLQCRGIIRSYSSYIAYFYIGIYIYICLYIVDVDRTVEPKDLM